MELMKMQKVYIFVRIAILPFGHCLPAGQRLPDASIFTVAISMAAVETNKNHALVPLDEQDDIFCGNYKLDLKILILTSFR